MDMVPGSVTYFWFTPTRVGTFDILCFELCGIGHYAMRGKVVVESQRDYQAWLRKQQTFRQSLAAAGNSGGNQSSLVATGAEPVAANGESAP